ncbi:MAG TPA: extracellular solute-binding protein [Candidatus Limivivens merdigallinarum]|uniref:Extracellular solute-binding protein n=1 Tax=Candidatus Limivivens merdigallinarum TaxID=2840859 RepID=A0A9D0ZYF6_9FIRM|nr:extracellular solute-binding protein [Candidatus Limivivens merdigallinarum]
MKKCVKSVLSVTMAASMVCAMALPAGASENETETEAVTEAAEASTEAVAEADYSILEGKTISFMTSQSKFFDAYQTMADAIEADYGCTVDFQVVPDDQYTSMTNLKLSTGEVPDVFEQNYPTQNATINVYEYCEPLDDQPWVSRLVNPDMLKDKKDGKMYALPKESSSGYQVVYYNKALLESCGITDPNPQTYDEFLEILQTIKDNSDAAPFLQTNKDNWETQIFMTGGIPVMLGDRGAEVYEQLLNNEITWSDIPEAQDVLQRYIDLYEAGYVNEDNLSVGYDDAAQIMADGKAAMYLTVDQWATDFTHNYPDVELGSFVIPFGDEPILPMGNYVQGLFVPKAGSQVDVAKTFLQVWSLPKYQNMYYEENPGYPGFTDVDGGEATPCVQSIVDTYVSSGNYVYELNGELSDANGCFNDLWNFYVEAAAGTKTADEVWEDFQPIYEDYMYQQGFEAFE